MNFNNNSYRNQSDQQLWASFKAGDKAAFETIYRKFFKQLYAYGMTVLPSQAVISDAIQQLFVDLWKQKGYLTNPDQLSFYLTKALRSKIYKYLEQEKKKLSVQTSLGREVEHLPSMEQMLIDIQEEASQKHTLKMRINNLSPQQREVIMLIFFEEKTYEEVSALLSISIQSVYTLVWKSISSLRKMYGQ